MDTTILIKALQLILSLSLLVFIHELGHFGFARLFKVRVTKFYLFFNWKFSIVRLKKIGNRWQVRWFAANQPTDEVALDENGNPIRDKKGKIVRKPIDTSKLPENDWRRYPENTEWGIGWLPLGGYCSIDGMVDETTDSGALAAEPKPWEYRAQAAWKRLLIITGGVLMNFVGAVVIYACVLGHWGKEQLPMLNATLGFDYCQTAENHGFMSGDIILAVDGDTVKYAADAVEKIIIEGRQNVLIRRGTMDTTLVLPEDFAQQLLASGEKSLMNLRIPFVIGTVAEKMPAAEIGMQVGDSIVGIDNQPITAFSEGAELISAAAGRKIEISFWRAGTLINDSICVDSEGKIGIQLAPPHFVTERTEYGFFAAIPAGWNQMIDVLGSYVKQFRLVFTKEGAKSLGGFGAIGSLFPPVWDWFAFWTMSAFLSVILAFMNILPIPILDGGYVLFILYELIARRKPNEKVMEILLNIGFYLLLALLIFANGNDILKLFM